jgi:hypothetical protein
VTTVSPVGILPNVLRRALAVRLTNNQGDFATRTCTLVAAFAPHLATLHGMTRTPIDWVQDNMLNPAYFGLCLTIPMVMQDLDPAFDAWNSCPSFAVDWRWFKELHGPARRFNDHFLAAYRANLHGFLDARQQVQHRDPERNRVLEALSTEIHRTVAALDQCGSRQTSLEQELLGLIHAAIAELNSQPDAVAALTEYMELYRQPAVRPGEVAGMTRFSRLFGRETIYLSLQRRPA